MRESREPECRNLAEWRVARRPAPKVPKGGHGERLRRRKQPQQAPSAPSAPGKRVTMSPPGANFLHSAASRIVHGGPPGGSNAVKVAALEVAGLSIRGSGWAPSGPASFVGAPSCPEPPGVPRGGTEAELGHCPDCTLTMLGHEAASAGSGAA